MCLVTELIVLSVHLHVLSISMVLIGAVSGLEKILSDFVAFSLLSRSAITATKKSCLSFFSFNKGHY